MQSLWMLLACAAFAILGACVKVASDFDASLSQVVIFRGVPSIILLFGWARLGHRTIAPSSWKLHFWRNVSGIASMWLGFYALAHLPLSIAVSLNYTAPLFIAGWMLVWGGSQRDPVRIIAVVFGFLGVIGVLRPSIENNNLLAASLGLLAGALAAVAMMQIRELGRVGEPEWRTVLIFSGCVWLSGIVGVMIQGWRDIGLTAWIALTGVGIAGLVGQLAMTRAFGLGSTLLTAALQYATIIFAAILGILFWGDRPDLLAWGGMVLIIGSGLLSVWRTLGEDRLMRGRAATAAGAAPAGAAAVD